MSLNFDLISFETFYIRTIKVSRCKHSSTSLVDFLFKETYNFLPIFWSFRRGTWCFNFSRKRGICREYDVVRLHQFTTFYPKVTESNKKLWEVIYNIGYQLPCISSRRIVWRSVDAFFSCCFRDLYLFLNLI